jgi:hypothetical protein
MTIADTSQTQLAYVVETTLGTTPATPTFTKLRYTGESLSPNITTTTSAEIRSDRNITDLIQTGQNAGGSVDFELSYGAFDTLLESVMFGAWTTNVLKNGTTQKGLTIEKLFETGATDNYHRFTGAVADTLSLSVKIGEVVKGSFGFLTMGMSSAQAAIAGATYSAATANDVINAATNFASLTMTGITSPSVTGIDLSITNNLRTQPVLGSLSSVGIGTGTFEVTGTLEAYFENKDLYEAYLNGTSSTLSFKLGGTSSKNYVFLLGKIKFEKADVFADGQNKDVMVKMNFRGLFDGTDNTLKITRTA